MAEHTQEPTPDLTTNDAGTGIGGGDRERQQGAPGAPDASMAADQPRTFSPEAQDDFGSERSPGGPPAEMAANADQKSGATENEQPGQRGVDPDISDNISRNAGGLNGRTP